MAMRPYSSYLFSIVFLHCPSRFVAAFFLPCLLAQAQQTPASVRDYQIAGKPLTAAPVDPSIESALREVSPAKIRANIEALVAFGNRNTISSTETDLPVHTGVLAASDWIENQFREYGRACGNCLDVKADDFIEPPQSGPRARIVRPTRIRNIYAILRGSDPAAAKRMYLVTGHYDTRETNVMDTHSFAPGANDDSSGTAVSLEVARVLSRSKFPATLVFVCVAGEEQGLDGSRHLALLAKQEGWQLEGVLNNDIVGGDTTPGDTLQNKSLVRVFSQGIATNAPAETIARMLALGMENDSPSRQLARAVLATDRTYLALAHAAQPLQAVMELRLDRFLRGGDHSSFSAEGFPAVRFTEWRENFDHQHQHVRTENNVEYGDLLKFDDFGYIAQVARLNLATMATLVSSPGMPENVRVVTSNLDNSTTLTWEHPANSSADIRYRIVWRETTASDWQYFADASVYGKKPKELQATLPISKDNVFFGVQACDAAAAHCSQAVAPVPEQRR